MEFEDFVKEGVVKRSSRNPALVNALLKSSAKSIKNIERTNIDELNAESVTAETYDIMRELIEVKLNIEGFKSYSHEATILFLKKFKEFNEGEIIFLDNLRKVRNGIKYYGKEVYPDDAEKARNFLMDILPKLKKLVKNEI